VSDSEPLPESAQSSSLSSLVKPGAVLGVLSFLAGFVTWLMARAFAWRTGLDYAWLADTGLRNLGDLILYTTVDFLQVLGSPMGVAAIVIIAALSLSWYTWARHRFRNSGLTGFWRHRLRPAALVAVAVTLTAVFVLPSLRLRNQLVDPPLHDVSTSDPKAYDVPKLIALWQERLQICAEVGELTDSLATHSVTCAGDPFAARAIAQRKIQALYVSYVLLVLLVVVLTYPDLRALVTWIFGHGIGGRSARLVGLSTALAICSVVSVAWIYVSLRARIAPTYGVVDSTGCQGYLIPAGGDNVMLYDPMRPTVGHTVARNRVTRTSGPRPDALSAYLAVLLQVTDASGYQVCKDSSGS